MNWAEAEEYITDYIRTQWISCPYGSAVQLIFEGEPTVPVVPFIVVNITGVSSDKSIWGSAGKRFSLEHGIVFYHAFVESNSGKRFPLDLICKMGDILQMQVLNSSINMQGSFPPYPVTNSGPQDHRVENMKIDGMLLKCSGSVPFTLLGTF